jgi:8-oxo-dGTP pyrophosphatase MutT (NUDIX family)
VEHVFRRAARLLVLTPDGRVLLLRLTPSFRDPFWVTPGGGLDDGESYESAAERELREEVGRTLPLGACIWTRTVVFTWERWRVHQQERTFVVPTAEAFEAVTVFPDEEPITGSGWFGVDDLRATTDTVYPIGLADHLSALLDTGIPESPLHLGAVVE